MTLAIMQPYFFPYIGYFQLIRSADLFVVYDNIQYTKKGWISRNRLLRSHEAALFSLPIKGDSDFLDVRDRTLAADFNRGKLLNQIRTAYARAPHFSQTYPLVEEIVRHNDPNLFNFLFNSVVLTCRHLGISTTVLVSSSVAIDHTLRGQDKVLALCEQLEATTYINSIGGIDLYSREAFRQRHVELKFLRTKPFTYPQFDNEFVPSLSIIDVLMFNPLDTVSRYLDSYYELL